MNLGNFVPRIKFLHDWNKKLGGDYFPTIRPYAVDKQHHYEGKIGEKFEVILKGVLAGYATLVSVNCELNLEDIPYEFLVTDTGSEKPEEIYAQFGIASKDRVILLLFRRQGAAGSPLPGQKPEAQAASFRKGPA